MVGSVLIVDDDPSFLALAARMLRDLGVETVVAAADATEAVKIVEQSRPDAVLVDVGLPDRAGTDLAYELSDLPWRPRVVITSSDRDAFLAIERQQERPEIAFIAKEEIAHDTLRQVLLEG